MTLALFAVGYACDAAIILGFCAIQLPSRDTLARRVRRYNWANVLSAPVLIAVEVVTGAWPVLVLTTAFGAAAVFGLVANRA